MTMRTPATCLLAAIAGFALSAGQGDARLLAYYPFDSDFTDASGNDNDLTIGSGSPSITAAAGETMFGGGAALFVSVEGDEHYLSLTSPITFAASDAWSIAFWGRRAAGSTNRQGMVIGDLGSSDFIWLSDGGGGVNGMRFRNSGGTSYNNGTAADNAFPDDGNYHHWALSADGAGNLTVYRDNVSLGTVSAVTTFDAAYVGQAFNSSAQSMNGQIDELYIFDEALDATAVDNLYNDVKDTTDPTLAPGDIVDGQGGGSVTVNDVVTYTITFSKEINPGTVDAGDFGNAGTAPFSIGTISETAPGVFSVEVMPTGAGSLQLEVSAGAAILDGWGNPLDTTTAITDDTTLTVTADTDPPTTSAMDPMAGSTNLLPSGDLTLTFNEFVQVDTGNITIHLADGTLVETIDVASGPVSIVDADLIIDPVGDLLTLTAYYV